jgi:hypothetical protein
MATATTGTTMGTAIIMATTGITTTT